MPLDAPVTSAEVNGKAAMPSGYAHSRQGDSAYDDVVRTTFMPFALLASASLLAACGDGINEGAGDHPGATTVETIVTDTTIEPADPAALSVTLPDMKFVHTSADYSGAHSVAKLDDGTYLVTGFDNESDPQQAERGAIWRSTDLRRFERVGRDISDADNQQTVSQVLALGTVGVVVGTDYSRGSDPRDFSRFDARAWITTDKGSSFTTVRIARDARVGGGVVIGDALVIWGFRTGADDIAQAVIWRSTDKGEHWKEQAVTAPPAPGMAPQPIHLLVRLLQFGDHLIAIGANAASDPDAGSDLPEPMVDPTVDASAWDAVDVGVWYSDDGGVSWQDAAPGGLAGLAFAQWPLDAAVVGNHLVVLASAGDTDSSGDIDFDGRLVGTAYSCDAALSSCVATKVNSSAYDYIDATVAARADGSAVIYTTMFNSGSSAQSGALVALDPATGQMSKSARLGDLEQVEAILVEGDTVDLFGRSTDTNLLQVATAGSDQPDDPAPSTTTTSVPSGPPPTIEAEVLNVTSPKPAGNFSGLHTVTQLEDGSWLGAGFDNDQDPETPEAAVLWRSTDLLTWTRVGGAISDEPGVQAISTLLAPDGAPLLAVGGTFDGIDAALGGLTATAKAWTSTDGGATWQEHDVAQDATIDGVVHDDDGLLAWGHAVGPRPVVPSRLWRSTDDGATWTQVEGASKGVNGSLGFVQQVLEWDGALVAISNIDTSDPSPEATPLRYPSAGDPVQVHLLRSEDGGESWTKLDSSDIAAPDATQTAVAAVVSDGHLLVAGAEAASYDSFQPVLWDCDADVRCTRHELGSSVGNIVAVSGDIELVDGIAVVLITDAPDFLIAQRDDFMLPWETAGRSYLTAYDPSTGKIALRSLTRINQVEDLVLDGDRVLALGRYEHPDGRVGDLEIAAVTVAHG